MLTYCVESTPMDVELIRRARLGDSAACNELVTQYRATAIRTARSFVRDRDLAEDIAQEAFVRTLLSLPKLRESQAFLSYLNRTIVRLSIDHIRKSSSSEIAMEVDPPTAPEKMPTEDAMYVHTVLDHLSPKLRVVLLLKEISGLDYASIAKTLRLPVGTVRSRLSAARSAFKALYLGGLADDQEGRR